MFIVSDPNDKVPSLEMTIDGRFEAEADPMNLSSRPDSARISEASKSFDSEKRSQEPL
jgi:hypothetical protein